MESKQILSEANANDDQLESHSSKLLTIECVNKWSCIVNKFWDTVDGSKRRNGATALVRVRLNIWIRAAHSSRIVASNAVTVSNALQPRWFLRFFFYYSNDRRTHPSHSYFYSSSIHGVRLASVVTDHILSPLPLSSFSARDMHNGAEFNKIIISKFNSIFRAIIM